MKIVALCMVLTMLVPVVWPISVGLEFPEDVNLPGPIMGWATWPKFGTNRDCDDKQNDCISATLIRAMADRLVTGGYSKVGYKYIIIDDGWSAMERTPNNELVADPKRFPEGMKALIDYVHSLGLKFGLYANYGELTCGGYPGSKKHLELDAQTFASWGVDYVKLTACDDSDDNLDQAYEKFGQFLRATGQPIVYSCAWPVYEILEGIAPNFSAVTQTCDTFRMFPNTDDTFDSVDSVIMSYAENQDLLVRISGPGHRADMDALVIGNCGMNIDQSKTQMAMWAMMASPLIMSNDLRNMDPQFTAILQNADVIAVNQDYIGLPARRIYEEDGIEIWTRKITPTAQDLTSFALVFRNTRLDIGPLPVVTTLGNLFLNNPRGYVVRDLFDGNNYGTLLPDSKLEVKVNPQGVVMLQAIIIPSNAITMHLS